VLHVIPSVSPVHGGPSRAIALMERTLAAAGIAVTTLTTDDDGPGRRLGADARPGEANGAARVYVRKWLEPYKVAPGAIGWLGRNVTRFDVVHVHALFSFVSTWACLIATLRGVPYVVRPLGVLSSYGMTQRRPWLKRLSLALVEGPLLRRAAAVHFTSEAEREEAHVLGIPMQGRVIPLGIEAAEPDAQGLSLPRSGGGRPVMLFLSRLDPKKNVESLLRGLSLLKEKGQAPLLTIAGDGAPGYVAGLKTFADKLGLAGDVLWLGHTDGARKAGALAGADLFVLPSFSENFGIAAAEAMRAGLPCVLGEGVGIAREAEAAGAALVVSPEPAAIAAAIERLLGDEVLRRDMAARAKAFAAREYAPSAMAERLIALYRTILSAPSRRTGSE
jgi:glycosyltransferase involved in cell wall biosynthesis